MSESLINLREAIKSNKKIELIPSGSDISEAKELKISNTDSSDEITLDLESLTNFITKVGDHNANSTEGSDDKTNDTNHSLRTIYQCWLNKDSSTADYLTDCESKKITVISFLERQNLISWLNGSSTNSQYIIIDETPLTSASTSLPVPSSSESGASAAITDSNAVSADVISSRKATEENYRLKKRQLTHQDELILKEIKINERNLIDHNKALRGNKLIDFSNVLKECEYGIMTPLKRQKYAHSSSSVAAVSHPSKPTSSSSSSIPSKPKSSLPSTSSSSSSSKPTKNSDPIIILSPSASALLSMSNIKDFLENGKFTDPTVESSLNSKNNSNVVQLIRNSKRFNKKIKFLVVNNVEKFFTKPEYWDRVIAIFTTGQEWQFKKYKYSEPQRLFQKYKGFYVQYKGDSIPPKVQSWNVEVIQIDRNRRFSDKQTAEYLWETLERSLSVKGFK
ncbi:unnamed protein product [[Candida] boidinii]|uniref:Unnamed protein product n=1 Tax=Candida boidinii TaxID=5477 RepID=A0A9W6SZ89_CANBO|nr:hypothetical protein B5S30_g1614 [[Candida] boidinii]OWB84320.1 hypothetical protein B5S33_g2963 [[Candida] boidinii]GME69132.1 unnamed protein product [[Candida] boidinii]GMG13319.1 unnamed protein product [[Candida] boidinii]